MQINVSYDQNPNTLPTGFVNAVNYVVNYLDTTFVANVTITLHVGYGEVAGTALSSGTLGESYVDNYVSASYSSVRNALLAQGAPGASTLPATSPLQGTLYMSPAEAQALGVGSAASANYYVGFNSTPGVFSYTPNATPASNQYYFVGVLEHEITEDLGRVSLINYQPHYYDTMDLFRYASPGLRSTSPGGTGSTAYFSINNGGTNLGSWNNDPNNGDFGDWYPSGPAGSADAFNDYTNPGVITTASPNDITLMQALGWSTSSPMLGAALDTVSASLLTQGAVENNGTMDLVWRASNAQTTVWAIDTSANVTTTSLGVIGTGWTILHSGHYLSGNTTQMLTDYTPNGTMTLWWVNNGVLTGINLGQHWTNIAYVDSGTLLANGVDDILVKNNIDNHMYVWWVNSTTDTLTGLDLGAYWGNISYVAGGSFLGNGVEDMLVKNNIDNGMYVWWVNPTTHSLTGINLGNYWANITYVAGGNFLANGSYDMLVKNNIDNHMYVWWVNTSTDKLAGIDLGAHWASIQYLTSGHFAGTGDEMLVQNTSDTHVYLWWVNTSNDTLTGVDLGAISTQWHAVASADYNGDGYTDIVWHNSQTGQVQLWLMGGFSGPTNSAAPAATATSGIDIVGDAVAFAPLHQPATIEAGATLELRNADSGTVTFAGPTGTLILDHAASFTGQVLGLTGKGNPSQSDVIDLRDTAFGAGITAAYAGTATGGTLTVSDAHGKSASVSLIGNYQNSTFALHSDGMGGTSVTDRAATDSPLHGQVALDTLSSTGEASASVSAHNGGAHYVGSFVVNLLSVADGREVIEWQFNLRPNSVQHTTQSYDVSVGGAGSEHNGASASQSLTVTIGGPGSDPFLFKPGFGTDVIGNFKGTDTIELDGFASIGNAGALQALLAEAQSGQAQPVFHTTDGGHSTAINLGDHDSIILHNVQLASLYNSNFAVHPLLIG